MSTRPALYIQRPVEVCAFQWCGQSLDTLPSWVSNPSIKDTNILVVGMVMVPLYDWVIWDDELHFLKVRNNKDFRRLYARILSDVETGL